jgi:hypothetical protein
MVIRTVNPLFTVTAKDMHLLIHHCGPCHLASRNRQGCAKNPAAGIRGAWVWAPGWAQV